MAILSKKIMQSVSRFTTGCGMPSPRFLDSNGGCVFGDDPLGGTRNLSMRRRYALQESLDRGEPYLYHVAPSVMTWVVALEHQRVLSGAMLGHEFVVEENGFGRDAAISYLRAQGMRDHDVHTLVFKMPSGDLETMRDEALRMQKLFYQKSGWKPLLMEERRQEHARQRQLQTAVSEVQSRGSKVLYAFDKERVLLSNIRAGDRNEARRILNEMLASIFLSAPQPVVLRARVIELMSCLTRAAIEDNPLLEPMIERTHHWTEQLVHAADFESLSRCLMQALDDFIDAVHLHGQNRSNVHVHRALEYISSHYCESISLRHVATHAGLSAYRLAHLFKEYTGKTVLEVIRQLRLRQAQDMLDRTSMSCADVAYAVGFGDQSFFTCHFKKHFGITPARYRRRAIKQSEG